MAATRSLEHFDDSSESPQGPCAPQAAWDDEIRAAALFRIAHLMGDDAFQRLGLHLNCPEVGMPVWLRVLLLTFFIH